MQNEGYSTNLEKAITILQNDKKYLQNENDKLKIQLEESIEEVCLLKAETISINDLLNKEIEKNKINQIHIEQLKNQPQLQNEDTKFENLNKYKNQQEKLCSLEQKILRNCEEMKMDKQRELDVEFHKFLDKLENKFNVDKQKYFEKYQLEKENLKDEIKKLYQEIIQYRREIEKLKNQLDKQQMDGKNSQKFNESKILDQRLEIYNNFEKEVPTLKKNQDNLEQRNLELKNQEQSRQNRLNGFMEIREQQQFRQQQENEQNKNTIKQMFRHIKKSHGFIEICFLLDITGSMDPYKQQAKKCIQESIKQIKMFTQKEAKWSVIGYQDFSEYKQLGSQYRQLKFTQDSRLVEEFLDSLVCAGGGDAAEDLRGGMKQMVKNLEWEKEFRLAILICDSPTHGRKYNGGVSDRYPNEDIEDAILELIDKNIFLMAIKFNQVTEVMYDEIKKIYQAQGKPELLLVEDAQNIGISNLSNLFVNLISNATVTITQMNNTASKINNKKTFQKIEIISAMENLCKKNTDPVNFDQDPEVEVIETKFEVFKVELSDQFLENHIQNIKAFKTENCFKPIKEPGLWDCKRTVHPFASGSLKQVFLMKKKDTPTELYAIKMPLGDKTYQSIEDAVKDCRSHLIAKGLLEKFIKDLEKNQKEDTELQIFDVQYTNILILKDVKQKNSFWVAERYFSGKFVKYNNNSAFILDDSNSLNHLMQAFSFYTFYKSNLNYIICDVQGIGQYMTDPAINTKEGNFDETDIGETGIKSYLGSYQGKSHLGRDYLRNLNIPDFEDI